MCVLCYSSEFGLLECNLLSRTANVLPLQTLAVQLSIRTNSMWCCDRSQALSFIVLRSLSSRLCDSWPGVIKLWDQCQFFCWNILNSQGESASVVSTWIFALNLLRIQSERTKEFKTVFLKVWQQKKGFRSFKSPLWTRDIFFFQVEVDKDVHEDEDNLLFAVFFLHRNTLHTRAKTLNTWLDWQEVNAQLIWKLTTCLS